MRALFSSHTHFPRAGGDPEVSRTVRWLALIWIPAFAGNTAESVGNMLVFRQAQDEDEWNYQELHRPMARGWESL